MNLIRYAVLFVVIYIVIRTLGRMMLKAPGRPDSEDPIADKMLACPTCGTYNASLSAFQKNNKFFCNEDCYKKENK